MDEVIINKSLQLRSFIINLIEQYRIIESNNHNLQTKTKIQKEELDLLEYVNKELKRNFDESRKLVDLAQEGHKLRIKDMRQSFDTSEGKLSLMKEQIDTMESEKISLNDKIKQKDSQLSTLTKTLADLNKDLASTKHKVRFVYEDKCNIYNNFLIKIDEIKDDIRVLNNRCEKFREQRALYLNKLKSFKSVISFVFKKLDTFYQNFNHQLLTIGERVGSFEMTSKRNFSMLINKYRRIEFKLKEYHEILAKIAKTSELDFNNITEEEILHKFDLRKSLEYLFKQFWEVLNIDLTYNHEKKLTEFFNMIKKNYNLSLTVRKEFPEIESFMFNNDDQSCKKFIEEVSGNSRFIKQLKEDLKLVTNEEILAKIKYYEEFNKALETQSQITVSIRDQDIKSERDASNKTIDDFLKANDQFKATFNFKIDGNVIENLDKFFDKKYSGLIKEFEIEQDRFILKNSELTKQLIDSEKEMTKLKENIQNFDLAVKEIQNNKSKSRVNSFSVEKYDKQNKVMQKNLIILERKIALLRRIFKAMKLDIDDKDLEKKFVYRMNEIKANPLLLDVQIEDIIELKNSRINEIQSDEPVEELNLSPQSLKESFNKNLHRKKETCESLKIERAISEQNKLTRNYLINSFSSWGRDNVNKNK